MGQYVDVPICQWAALCGRSVYWHINDKHYAFPFEMDSRKLFKIGVNFSAETRNIEKWIVETESSSKE